MRGLFTLLILLILPSTLLAQGHHHNRESRTMLIGEVVAKSNGEPIAFATIAVTDGGQYACVTDKNGRFKLALPAGKHTIAASFIGYESFQQEVVIEQNQRAELNISLKEQSVDIGTVEIQGESNSTKVNKLAFNVQAVAIDDLKNTTANLTDVLSKVNGVRIRESGGVGSETKISLNGFSGSHVKIFIDGILQDGNSAFSLNNIPANFAERIEVYSGVVPIEFGADALGGVINIVSKSRSVEGWDLDASYSYGSFNTHRSDLTFTHNLSNGFHYKINAYQNYSDNNYKIDNTVTIYEGNISYTPADIYTVERFNDTYHNEAIIADFGVRDKRWADVVNLKLNYAQYYREIQTGTRQDVVYGGRHREGYSVIPTIQYSKRDLLIKGLELKANASSNYGITTVVDTTVFAYNWFGDRKEPSKSRSYTYRETKDNSWSANANATYQAGEAHTIALNYALNSTARVTRSADAGTTFGEYDEPQYTTKGVTGLSYSYRLNEAFNAQAFGKYYTQSNDGVTYDEAGSRSERNEKKGYFGYGAAATMLFLDGFQLKGSYELTYRLPTTTELFGDSDLEYGNVALNPEKSDNYNASITYSRRVDKHSFELGGGVIYSYSSDYIRRKVGDNGESAYYVNHGEVETKGWNSSFSYSYSRLLTIGGSINALNARSMVKTDVDTGYASTSYGERMPNEPYLYASGDSRVNLYKIANDDDHLYIVYSLLYQHDFPLYWENIAESSTKRYVPTQWSHDVSLHYSLKRGKYNFSLECKNITDAKLYDNFSLQKAGRAFYGKMRVNLGKTK